MGKPHRIGAYHGWINGREPRRVLDSKNRFHLVYGRSTTVEDVDVLRCDQYNVWEKNKYNQDRELKRPLPAEVSVDEDFLRFVGLYLADGYITKYITQLALISDQKRSVRTFAVDYLASLGMHISAGSRPGVVQVASKALASVLSDQFGSGAYEKQIPLWILLLPPEKQEALLEGIYAGDGSYGNNLEIVNQRLAESIAFIEARCGRHSSIKSRTRPAGSALPEGRTTSSPTKTYTVRWHKTQDSQRRTSGSPLYVIHDGDILVPIRDAKEVPYVGVVHNLHVQEDESYVADTYVVHNCWGTAINRFVAQALVGYPLTIYGTGKQTRGYLPLRDSLRCIELLCENPPNPGEYRVVNQFDQDYSILKLAEIVRKCAVEAGLPDPGFEHHPNPRVEEEEHYYNPDRKKLVDLGYVPKGEITEEVRAMFKALLPHRERAEALTHTFAPKTIW